MRIGYINLYVIEYNKSNEKRGDRVEVDPVQTQFIWLELPRAHQPTPS